MRTHTFGVFLLTMARRYDDAIALAKKGLELDPNLNLSRAMQAAAYAEQGRFKEAVANARQATQQDRTPRSWGLPPMSMRSRVRRGRRKKC